MFVDRYFMRCINERREGDTDMKIINMRGQQFKFNAFSRKVWAQYDDDTPHNVSYCRVNKKKPLSLTLLFSLSLVLSFPLSTIIVFLFFRRCNFQCTHSVRHKEGPFFRSQFQLLKLSLNNRAPLQYNNCLTTPSFIST